MTTTLTSPTTQPTTTPTRTKAKMLFDRYAAGEDVMRLAFSQATSVAFFTRPNECVEAIVTYKQFLAKVRKGEGARLRFEDGSKLDTIHTSFFHPVEARKAGKVLKKAMGAVAEALAKYREKGGYEEQCDLAEYHLGLAQATVNDMVSEDEEDEFNFVNDRSINETK